MNHFYHQFFNIIEDRKQYKLLWWSICNLDRDVQCDFESEFWEESKCSWKYSQSTITALSLGTVSRMERLQAGNCIASGACEISGM